MAIIKQTEKRDLFISAARRAVIKAGWDPQDDLEILRPSSSGDVSSETYGYKSYRVRLHHCPNLLSEIRHTLTLIEQRAFNNEENILNDVVASRVYLQIGSFIVCPLSVGEYYKIRDASADGLRSAGANETEVADFITAATSLFIASVVSSIYGIEGPDPVSFRRGWVLDHIISSVSREASLTRYIALYANIQLSLWCDDEKLARILRNWFPRPFEALEFETDRGVSILLDTVKYSGFGVDRPGLASDKNLCELIIDRIRYDFEKWPVKAFQWAEMFAPYIIAEKGGRDLPPQAHPWPQVNPYMLVPASEDLTPSSIAQGRMDNITANVPSMPVTNGTNGRGGIRLDDISIEPYSEMLVNDTQFLEQMLQTGIGLGKGIMNMVLDLETLDILYKLRATNVEIESEPQKRKDMTFDMTYVAKREADPECIHWNKVNYSGLRFNKEREPILYEKELPLKYDIPVQEDNSGFPDLLFVVDSSSSMGWDPRRGKGPYDCLLRAVYSVFVFLERKGKGQHMKFAAVNFSKNTIKTQWVAFNDLLEIKKMLFKHQRGGTILNCNILRQIVNESEDRFLYLMITDGQISNSSEVLETLKMIKSLGHGVVFIQIGNRSKLSTELEKSGISAPTVNDPNQLSGLFLSYAQKNW